ncbi:MAG: thiol:disulfide interchange protein DsbA/DsbL, partial [Alcaligenaceae bacterium]|nr:thiol:disulfide interchange protein DsbA/DsbL [Alcaligenaceae bacterium]
MMLKTIFKHTFSALAIMGAAAFVPAMAQSGIKYITLETAQPSDTP